MSMRNVNEATAQVATLPDNHVRSAIAALCLRRKKCRSLHGLI